MLQFNLIPDLGKIIKDDSKHISLKLISFLRGQVMQKACRMKWIFEKKKNKH